MLASFGAAGKTMGNDAGMSAAQRALAAAKARAGTLTEDDARSEDGAGGEHAGQGQGAGGDVSPAAPHRVKGKTSVSKRRETRKGSSGGGGAAAAAAAKATVAAVLEGGGGEAEDLVHSVSGVLSMAEMLRKKRERRAPSATLCITPPLRHPVPSYATPSHPMPPHPILCHPIPSYATPSHPMTPHPSPSPSHPYPPESYAQTSSRRCSPRGRFWRSSAVR